MIYGKSQRNLLTVATIVFLVDFAKRQQQKINFSFLRRVSAIRFIANGKVYFVESYPEFRWASSVHVREGKHGKPDSLPFSLFVNDLK